MLVCLFVYSRRSNFLAICMAAVTITGDTAAILDLCLAFVAFSSEGSFGRRFLRSHPKDRHPRPTVGFELATQESSDLCAVMHWIHNIMKRWSVLCNISPFLYFIHICYFGINIMIGHSPFCYWIFSIIYQPGRKICNKKDKSCLSCLGKDSCQVVGTRIPICPSVYHPERCVSTSLILFLLFKIFKRTGHCFPKWYLFFSKWNLSECILRPNNSWKLSFFGNVQNAPISGWTHTVISR
jgi:hypothetical protein